MPRVKLAEDKYKNKDLAELIRLYKYGKGLTNADMAQKIGICQATLKNYLANPEKMSLGTIRKVQKLLQIPKEELTVCLL